MSKDAQQAVTVNEELARRELDILAAEQDADLAAPAGDEYTPGEPGAPGDMGNAACVAMGLDMAVAMGEVYFPSLKATAPPEKRQAVAASVGAVMDKYGVSAGGWLSQYGVELAALVTCGSFGVAVYAGIKADIAAREAAAAAANPKPQTASAAPEPAPAEGEEAQLPGWGEVAKAA